MLRSRFTSSTGWSRSQRSRPCTAKNRPTGNPETARSKSCADGLDSCTPEPKACLSCARRFQLGDGGLQARFQFGSHVHMTITPLSSVNLRFGRRAVRERNSKRRLGEPQRPGAAQPENHSWNAGAAPRTRARAAGRADPATVPLGHGRLAVKSQDLTSLSCRAVCPLRQKR